VIEVCGGLKIRCEILHRLREGEKAVLNSIQLGQERRALLVGDTIEQHDELVVDAGRVPAIGGQELAQRRRSERPPDEMDDGNHAW
jgi:hypothetical protein